MRAVIHPVSVDRLPALLPLWRESMAYHAALVPHFRPAPDAAQAWHNFAALSLARGTGAAFAAETGRESAGFIFGLVEENPPVFLPGRFGHIHDLYVQPACRRHGLGRLLFLALRDWFAGQGVTALELQAYLANPEAGAFWRKMGFAGYAERMRSDASPEVM